jgi:hypothetical protein
MRDQKDTPWTRAARAGVRKVADALIELDRAQLKKAGIYREKIAAYRKRTHVPSSANLIAALIICDLQIEVVDPETGATWVLRPQPGDPQLHLPLPGH